jgi:hypothetical protein
MRKERTTFCKPRREASRETNFADIMVSLFFDFQPPEL